LGESEEKLRSIFLRAKEFAPSVILFDELDAIAPNRTSNLEQSYKGIVAQLLVLLDGLESRGRVYVLGTTNRKEDIDKALLRPGRFDNHIHLGLPDKKGRSDIFKIHLSKLKTADDIDLQLLAGLTKKCSGADIAHVCKMAAMNCVKESIYDKNKYSDKSPILIITIHHIISAIDYMVSTKIGALKTLKYETQNFNSVSDFKQFASVKR